MSPYLRILRLAPLLALTACESDPYVPPEGAGLQVAAQIIQPTQTLFGAGSEILLQGQATLSNKGTVPGDSVWWSVDGTALGTGFSRVIEPEPGIHQIRFHVRYGAARDSIARTITVDFPIGQVIWSARMNGNTGGDGLALHPAGFLVTVDNPDVVAIDTATGQELWRTTPEPIRTIQFITPAIAPNGTILLGSYLGALALDASGTVLWEFAPHPGDGDGFLHVHGGVAVAPNGTIYFGAEHDDGRVYALGPDGTLLWSTPTGDPAYGGRHQIFSPPVVLGNSMVVIVPEQGFVAGLDARTGTLGWRAPATIWGSTGYRFFQFGIAVDDDGTLYTMPDELLSIDPAGSVNWASAERELDAGISAVIAEDGRLVLNACDGNPIIVEAMTGNTLVDSEGYDPRVCGTPALGRHGIMYHMSADSLISYDANLERRYAVHAPRPLLLRGAGQAPLLTPAGNVYYRADTAVIAVRDTVPPAESPWPMYQGGPQRRGYRH